MIFIKLKGTLISKMSIFFPQSEIRSYRKKGFDVSDGLLNHLDQAENNESFFWKPRTNL